MLWLHPRAKAGSRKKKATGCGGEQCASCVGWGVSENNTKSCGAGRESQSIHSNFNGFAKRSAALTSVEPYATLMGGNGVSDPGVFETQSRACGIGRSESLLTG